MKSLRQHGKLQNVAQETARNKILTILSDGKWHRIKDLRKAVSSRTLYDGRFLDTFERFIEKREDKENGKYAVFYRANPTLMSAFFQMDLTNAEWKDIEEQFLTSKDLSFALEQLNIINNLNIVMTLTNIKSKNFAVRNPEIVKLFFETFVFSPYEILVSRLVNASRKIINDIDLNQVMKELK